MFSSFKGGNENLDIDGNENVAGKPLHEIEEDLKTSKRRKLSIPEKKARPPEDENVLGFQSSSSDEDEDGAVSPSEEVHRPYDTADVNPRTDQKDAEQIEALDSKDKAERDVQEQSQATPSTVADNVKDATVNDKAIIRAII